MKKLVFLFVAFVAYFYSLHSLQYLSHHVVVTKMQMQNLQKLL